MPVCAYSCHRRRSSILCFKWGFTGYRRAILVPTRYQVRVIIPVVVVELCCLVVNVVVVGCVIIIFTASIIFLSGTFAGAILTRTPLPLNCRIIDDNGTVIIIVQLLRWWAELQDIPLNHDRRCREGHRLTMDGIEIQMRIVQLLLASNEEPNLVWGTNRMVEILRDLVACEMEQSAVCDIRALSRRTMIDQELSVLAVFGNHETPWILTTIRLL